jgi:hypothetical protein
LRRGHANGAHLRQNAKRNGPVVEQHAHRRRPFARWNDPPYGFYLRIVEGSQNRTEALKRRPLLDSTTRL